jgi:DNA-binding CsgD family transcriptional regulator
MVSYMAGTSPKLSGREREVVELASEGLLDKEIMIRLGITENTLKTYWKRIRMKLGEGSRPGLVAEYLSQKPIRTGAAEIHFDADWVYDYRTRIWTQTSERPLPANIQIDRPVSIEEILGYFHPDDAEGLREVVEGLNHNEVDDFFFRARILVPQGFVQTSTFVHVIRDDAPMPVQDLMVGYWEQDIPSGEFTIDVNLLFIFGKTGETAGVAETKYQRIPPDELKEIRELTRTAIEQKRHNVRRSHRLDTVHLPFRWATIDANVEFDAAGRGRRAHGSVLAFN